MKYDRILFGNRVRELRIKNNQSLNDVALSLSTTKSSVGNIEHARTTISVNMLIAFAEHFDVSIDYLLGRTDNPNAHKRI